MDEYVFRLIRRPKGAVLRETVLMEHGVQVKSDDALANSLSALSQMLRIHGTPEKVVEFMKTHAAVAKAGLITKR